MSNRKHYAEQMAFDMPVSKLITALKEAGQDFEFYPTTNEIIRAMVADVKRGDFQPLHHWHRSRGTCSVLDIGAGNGKVLSALREAGKGTDRDRQEHFAELYAIEKSPILRQQLEADIFVVGTDFEAQSLLSKNVDVIFSNPPYSEFVPWTTKILRESAAWLVYLVIPVRWQESANILDAIKFRGGKTKIVGEFSFENAEDRNARARVHLLRVELPQSQEDAFDRFFDEQFGHLREKFEAAKNKKGEDGDKSETQSSQFSSLVIGESYPAAMVALYNAEMAKIEKNYHALGLLDVALLQEIGIEPTKIMACLKQRLTGLRNVYWKEIFDNMGAITDRLCRQYRQNLLETLNKHAHVDFTEENISAVILWVLKNANKYLDSQLIVTFEQMVDKANVKVYKSNLKPFVWDRWRYRNEPGSRPTHFALEYRIVLSGVGGIGGNYSWDKGLCETAAHYLGDLLTVARNLGFQNDTANPLLTVRRQEWISNGKQTFYCINPKTQKREILMEVRAFQNRNCHIRIHQDFALALNVEYGRLKGWLKSGEQAADELQEPEAAALFKTNLCLPTSGNSMLLLAGR